MQQLWFGAQEGADPATLNYLRNKLIFSQHSLEDLTLHL